MELCRQIITMSELDLLFLTVFCLMYIFTSFSVNSVSFLRILCFMVYRTKLIVSCICVRLIDKSIYLRIAILLPALSGAQNLSM